MFAIIEVGAKQFTVKKGDVIEVEKIDTEAKKTIVITDVLLVAKGEQVEIGTPFVKGAKVSAEIVAQIKGEKTIAYKYRRRKASHTKKGGRKKLTQLKITEISL
jgi:large subunit ribosomal protein L21